MTILTSAVMIKRDVGVILERQMEVLALQENLVDQKGNVVRKSTGHFLSDLKYPTAGGEVFDLDHN